MLVIIVPLEDPLKPKLQLPPVWSKTASEHYQATTVLRRRQGIFLNILYALFYFLRRYCLSTGPKSFTELHRTESKKRLWLQHTGADISWGQYVLLCTLLCKLKPQWLLPSSLAAGLLQSLEYFSLPHFDSAVFITGGGITCKVSCVKPCFICSLQTAELNLQWELKRFECNCNST